MTFTVEHVDGAVPFAQTTRYFPIPLAVALSSSLNPCHCNAICPGPGVAATVPFTGFAVSRLIVSVTGAGEVFCDKSRNHAYTVFDPVPLASVQLFVPANGIHVVQAAPVLFRHIWTGSGSFFVNVRVTAALFVHAAPPLIVTLPAGGVESVADAEAPASTVDNTRNDLILKDCT
jgi:hypothetical protein